MLVLQLLQLVPIVYSITITYLQIFNYGISSHLNRVFGVSLGSILNSLQHILSSDNIANTRFILKQLPILLRSREQLHSSFKVLPHLIRFQHHDSLIQLILVHVLKRMFYLLYLEVELPILCTEFLQLIQKGTVLMDNLVVGMLQFKQLSTLALQFLKQHHVVLTKLPYLGLVFGYCMIRILLIVISIIPTHSTIFHHWNIFIYRVSTLLFFYNCIYINRSHISPHILNVLIPSLVVILT